MASPRRPLGRPPLPVAAVEARPGWLGCEDRIAWLLRTNRLYGADDRLAVAATFARAFAGVATTRPADPAQVSRWERGKQKVDYDVLCRYEVLLGLPEASLTGTANTVCREVRGTPGASELVRVVDPSDACLRRRTHELIDRALSDDVMPALAWDELTENLWSLGVVFLHPEQIWSGLAERLTAEMLISDGLDWHLRSESLSRLLGHPSGELPVIGACASLVADPMNQVFIDPLTALEVSAHPETATQLLKQIVNPTNDHAALAALYSVVEKIGRGHFSPDQLAILTRRAVAIVNGDIGHAGLRGAATALLRQANAPRTRATSIDSPSAAGATTRAGTANDEMDSEAFRTFVGRVAASATSGLPRDPLGDDPMLTRLLLEMLFHPHITARIQATKLIEATPYRRPVATALAAELRQRATLANEAWAGPILLALTSLGGPGERQLVERLILARGMSKAVVDAAAWALGHVRGTSDDRFYVDALRATAQSHQVTAMSAGRGLIYAMGVGRHMKLLRALATSPALPPGLKTAAAWWTNLPANIMRSTNRGAAPGAVSGRR